MSSFSASLLHALSSDIRNKVASNRIGIDKYSYELEAKLTNNLKKVARIGSHMPFSRKSLEVAVRWPSMELAYALIKMLKEMITQTKGLQLGQSPKGYRVMPILKP